MKRKSKFWVGLASTALTFGALMAFVGPRHHHYRGVGHNCHHECNAWHQHDCGDKMHNDSTKIDR